VRIVQHYAWRGVPHHQLYPQLLDLLRSVWRCRRVAVDATGLGAGVASFLEKALGKSVVEAVTFTAQSKSRLGYDLIAAVNTGRLKMYAADGSPEGQEFWRQVCRARASYRSNQAMSFYMDPSEGHDDYLSSLALLVEAARYLPRVARGRAPVGLAAATS
jgi:phage FluMu gp28-like protein